MLSAPHFVTKKGPGTPVDPTLFEAWSDFDMATALATALGKPTKVANDADVQGAAVVAGQGLEVVITLGTGFGTAVFMDGQLLPHLEIAHQPFRKDETYNEQLGELARKKIGDKHWNRRAREAIACLDALFFFDHLFIGGGNASRIDRDDLGELLERITVVDEFRRHPRRHQAVGRPARGGLNRDHHGRHRRAAGLGPDRPPLQGRSPSRSGGGCCATRPLFITTPSATSTR